MKVVDLREREQNEKVYKKDNIISKFKNNKFVLNKKLNMFSVVVLELAVCILFTFCMMVFNVSKTAPIQSSGSMPESSGGIETIF